MHHKRGLRPGISRAGVVSPSVIRYEGAVDLPRSENKFFLGGVKTNLDHQKSKHQRHYFKTNKQTKSLYLKGLGFGESGWYRNSGTSVVG